MLGWEWQAWSQLAPLLLLACRGRSMGVDGTWLAHWFAIALHVFTTALLPHYYLVGALAFMFNPVCLRQRTKCFHVLFVAL